MSAIPHSRDINFVKVGAVSAFLLPESIVATRPCGGHSPERNTIRGNSVHGGAVQVADEYVHRQDKHENILVPVEAQREWLRELGFLDVDCYFKLLEFAVFGGRRAARIPRLFGCCFRFARGRSYGATPLSIRYFPSRGSRVRVSSPAPTLWYHRPRNGLPNS